MQLLEVFNLKNPAFVMYIINDKLGPDLWRRPRYICEPAAFIIPYLMGHIHCSSNENEINVFLEQGDTRLPIQKSQWRIIDDANSQM